MLRVMSPIHPHGRLALGEVLSPHLAVEGAVLYGFRYVRDLDLFRASEVGDGATDLQNPVVSAAREAQLLNGGAEEILHIVLDRAKLFDLLGPHLSVAVERPFR